MPSQAWATQVERLSGLMISVAHSVSQTSFSPRRTLETSVIVKCCYRPGYCSKMELLKTFQLHSCPKAALSPSGRSCGR